MNLPPPPGWLTAGDRLWRVWDQGREALAEGRDVIGWIYMANGVLWQPGIDDAPAGVVYSFDPAYRRRPDALEPVGSRLFAFYDSKGQPAPKSPWLRRTRRQLMTGYERYFNERVPPELTSGRVVYDSTVMVWRDHLPTSRIVESRIPLKVLPGPAGVAVIPPVSHWPPGLAEVWKDAVRR